jgi:hypothetical protein
VQLEVVVLAFKVLVQPLVLMLVLLIVVLQLIEVLGYLIRRLLLVELAKSKLGILVNLGLLVLFL